MCQKYCSRLWDLRSFRTGLSVITKKWLGLCIWFYADVLEYPQSLKIKPSAMVRFIFVFGLIAGLTGLAAGCGNTPPEIDMPEPPRHSMSLDGEVALSGRVSWDAGSASLKTTIRAENTGEQQATIRTGPCSIKILAFAGSDSDGKLIWSNTIPENHICFDEMLVYTLEPGEEKEMDGLMNISGNQWKQDVPKGKWQFAIQAKTDDDQMMHISSSDVVIE